MYISIRPLFVVAAWHWGSELFNSIMMYVYTYIYGIYILYYIDIHRCARMDRNITKELIRSQSYGFCTHKPSWWVWGVGIAGFPRPPKYSTVFQ